MRLPNHDQAIIDRSKRGTLHVVWQYDRDATTGEASERPRMITNWLAVWTEEGDDD